MIAGARSRPSRKPVSSPPAILTALIIATIPMRADYEKANALILLARGNRLDEAGARKAYFRSAETMTSSYDYRRSVTEVLK